ncbi:MAG: N-acetylmuramoyl-L-alanine amidase, partial [Gemmatimonadota bacterium]|nr:N-acetylmuramoyl-L-alanine amidase [Gemmatimonadota bacterium]
MVTLLPKDLPERLRKAGLKVVTIDGWETRGRPGSFAPVGVLNHHTGSFDRDGDFADDLAYAKWLFLQGRADLPAPLCQMALSVEGTVYLGAAGRTNHGGVAKASGSVASGDANTLYIGIEWMLSGTQAIPAKMMKAAAVLNAVLTQQVTKTSVQTISCHYQTSVTGKWDIGDPNGISYGSAKVLNVPKFRVAVQVERDRLVKPPKRPTRKVSFQHTPMQFSDTEEQMRADVERIFSRGKDHLSGTETGDRPLMQIVKAAAEKHCYRLHLRRSVWVAVKKTLIKEGSRVQT